MTQLRITGRCQREDLTSPSLRPVAHLLIEKFHELRGQAPDGGEGISGLRDRPCKSLHASHYRGITWYDQQHDVVWLLAAHIHREGSHDDSYQVAIELERAGGLYPSAQDYEALAKEVQASRIGEEARALHALRREVLAAPGSGRHRYESPSDLYVEMWAEAIPDLALLILRVRMHRSISQGISQEELAILVKAVFESRSFAEVGDRDGRFQRFEGYFPREGTT